MSAYIYVSKCVPGSSLIKKKNYLKTLIVDTKVNLISF